ncbi:MAG: MFS transporter [Acidobacteria bacterium]|nr:MFS transporter [Acidobacteriota bacterium]
MKVPASIEALLSGPQYKWVVIGLLFFAGFLNLEDRVVIFSVLPLIRKELHLSDLQLGALMSTFLWVYAACSPFAGYAGDRLPRRRVVIACLFLWSLVTIWAGLVTTGGQLMATRVVLAVAQAFYVPASMAILADCHDESTRGRAVAILASGMTLGPILGGGAAGWIGDHYGWRPSVIILGVLGILLSAVFLLLLKNVEVGSSDRGKRAPSAPAAGFADTMRVLLSIPSYVSIIIALGVFSLATWMLVTWLPVFLHDSFGMSLAQSGLFGNFSISGPTLIGLLLGGVISDRLGRESPRNRLILMLGCYSLAMPWPVLFRYADGALLVLASAFMFKLFRALAEVNSYPLIYALVPPEKRSTAMGVSNSLNTIFGGAGALVIGYFRESFGFQSLFGLVPLLIAVAVAGLLMTLAVFLRRDLGRVSNVPGVAA